MGKPRESTDSSAPDTEALLEEHSRSSFNDSYDGSLKPRPSKQLFGLVIGFLGGLALTATLSALYFTFALPQSHRGLAAVPTGNDPIRKMPSAWYNGECGNSSAEALSRDCRFDMVSFSWLPPACLTAEDVADEAEFMAVQPWRWFVETEDIHRKEIFEAEVRKGEFNVIFTSWEWHVTHCVFLWKKMHRALLSGGEVDTYMRNYGHTTHCGDMLLVEKPKENSETSIFAKFPTCLG